MCRWLTSTFENSCGCTAHSGSRPQGPLGRCRCIGRLLSEGYYIALLLSHLSSVLWCMFWLNIRRTSSDWTYAGHPLIEHTQDTLWLNIRRTPSDWTYAGSPLIERTQDTFWLNIHRMPSDWTYAGHPLIERTQDTLWLNIRRTPSDWTYARHPLIERTQDTLWLNVRKTPSDWTYARHPLIEPTQDTLWLNLHKTTPSMPLLTVLARWWIKADCVSLPESRLSWWPSINPPAWTLVLKPWSQLPLAPGAAGTQTSFIKWPFHQAHSSSNSS